MGEEGEGGEEPEGLKLVSENSSNLADLKGDVQLFASVTSAAFPSLLIAL